MRPAWLLAAVLAIPGIAAGQATATLHVVVTLRDASKATVPVARHALLVSDNPSTREPRRVLTGTDGTVTLTLRPGSYTIESDRPVAFAGAAYQWTQMVDVVAGRTTPLTLTADNADLVPLAGAADTTAAATPASDPVLVAAKWQDSVVTIWSPTARASGVLVDARGLIATHGAVARGASTVEVQLSPTAKVPARVIESDATRNVTILWIDPGAVAGREPLALPCPPAVPPSLEEGQELVALVASPTGPGEPIDGEVTTLAGRTVDADLRLGFGGTGGPAFDESGAVVGLTALPPRDPGGRAREARIVRIGPVCDALAAAQAKLAGARPPDATALPTEAIIATTSGEAGAGATGLQSRRPDRSPIDPPIVSSDDFDLAFITPSMVTGAGQKADWSGGRSGRSPEAEARIGRVTEFGAWAEYFADRPPVLAVRVTPQLVEGFWKRLAREAARTQGAELPAFKDFTSSFVRLRALCGTTEVTPIHPFVLEHAVSEKTIVREGLYVFDPGAFGPHCQSVSFAIYAEKHREQADTVSVPAAVVERIWSELAPYRTPAR
jgi:S1-C subfamily serine protease